MDASQQARETLKSFAEIKPIETIYNGHKFRSRLEARWAVFFDACGVNWEYEPEGFVLPDGTCYLPDFLLHGVEGRAEGDLFVEVKGKMTETDAKKIEQFGFDYDENFNEIGYPLIVVGNIPEERGGFLDCEYGREEYGVAYFDFRYVDLDEFDALPGLNKNGGFELFGTNSEMMDRYDYEATRKAYAKARQAQFEHGKKG